INTILFLYFEGSIPKLLQEENKITIKRSHEKSFSDVKFVDVLERSAAVNIDTEPEEEEKSHHKTRKEVLNEIYPGYPEEEFYPSDNQQKTSSSDDIVIIEDDYPKQ
ncbi:MAG: hypothetical protein II183_02475, partial [Elusimicrobiaceae bacterium]|nr:hypothetical protein [Elusimicrobiaceae bacterium]